MGEYDKVSPHPYDDNLKISTLMAGLPNDVKKYLQLNLDDSVNYERLRNRLLQYERTTAMWSSEHLLRSVGIDKDSGKFLDVDGGVPMDVDRVEQKGKGKGGKEKGAGKGKGKGGKDKGGKGKQKDGYGKSGWNQQGNGKGWGNWGGQGGWNDKRKGKGHGGKGKGKGKEKGKRQVGPCFTCGRMGHVAADCRSRVNQVADDASSVTTQTPSSAASSSSSTRTPSLPATHSTNIRRLEVWHEHEEPQELQIYTPPDTPMCTFYDLASQDDDDDRDSGKIFEVRVVTCEEISAAELASTSTLLFDMASSDSDGELECPGHVRAVNESGEREYEQVILDSGADVTVVPMTHGNVGHASVNNQSLCDAQGNRIPMAGQRQDVVFEVVGTNGQRLFFKDTVVVAQVKQPLMCMGKLMRDSWLPRQVDGEWVLQKGDQVEIPLQLTCVSSVLKSGPERESFVCALSLSFLSNWKLQLVNKVGV